MDRLTSMAVFVRVVEKGSFVAAAEEMAISPTMVGKHIRYLEQRLNTPLLNRTTRRQGLTEAGRVFYERCRRLLADADAAEASARALLSSPSGLLRISAPVTFGNRVLTPILTEFLQRHPEVEAEVVLSDRKVDLIEESYEAAFRIGPVADDGLVARALPDYRMTLAASPDYLAQQGVPMQPTQLSTHSCFGFSQWDGNHFWRLQGPEGKLACRSGHGCGWTLAKECAGRRWPGLVSRCMPVCCWTKILLPAGWCGCCRTIRRCHGRCTWSICPNDGSHPSWKLLSP